MTAITNIWKWMKRKILWFFVGTVALAATVSTLPEKSVTEKIEGKTSSEAATIIGQEIAKIGKVERTRRDKYEFEILSMKPVPYGVEFFARVWTADKPVDVKKLDDEGRPVYSHTIPSNTQIGFGLDGTVDIERFVMVGQDSPFIEDPNGTIEKYDIGKDGTLTRRTFREDLQEVFLRNFLVGTVDVKRLKFDNSRIVPGKIGQTTYTFYPAAGAVSPVDGLLFKENSTNWDTTHDATDAEGVSATAGTATLIRGGISGNYRIDKSVYMFATGAQIASSETISSATFSFYPTVVNNSNSISIGIVQIQNGFVSSSSIAVGDFDQIGTVNTPTEGATRLALSAITTDAYNDIALNATGLTWIARSGETIPVGFNTAEITPLGLRSSPDLDDSAPAGDNEVVGRYADVAGDTDPKLVVEAGVAAAGVSEEIVIE